MSGDKDPKTVRVDPEVLRGFAQQLGTEAQNVTGLGTAEDANISGAITALPGTTFGTAAQRACDATGQCLQRISDRLTTVADSLRNTAGAYELTEADFEQKLKTIGLQQ
ncbi:ESX-1 secretion-associated protein [Nocardia cyriacigeorgica]|uniref:ESX-1 secretion-associated protein n=1 Tax=Nocardia cyriacigeorgica TaxID=135487 RepID=A0A6P1D220_9NOCA|nr:type VII secretion target [Nocardia cyriacigeorgica]NEW41294.1 ESX-1 secretion-associated protein [Nocardia cyriacigeorgica]NEW44546.1 ESX-1 secretion-associated protein [Nocardia cyriacigeorgica]NEW52197.1 ESX-1 secretion-associated protein [Nocardia cyriacigeorgica]NEW55894.1 ESX-1 secretion-associated protein [Nocardia cyriacigeorgica]